MSDTIDSDSAQDEANPDYQEDNSGESGSEAIEDDEGEDHQENSSSRKRKIHRLSLDRTSDFNERLKKRGVVYIARIPPRMTPTKLKKLLEEFEVTRVFLVEEDAAVRKRRRQLSGHASKRYTEGWIEFASKKVAKKVASSFNNMPMSNYKRSHHHDDLWNLKYLSKFQWSHLTEKVAYERRVREQKLRLETMQARRETASYKKLVEAGKKLDKIADRRQRQGKAPLNLDRQAGKPVRQVQPIDEYSGGRKAKTTDNSLLRSIL